MGQTVQLIRIDYEAAIDDVLDLCGRASDRDWQTTCAAEGWPVGTVIHHVAAANQVICDWIRALAGGQDIATSGQEVDRMNAAHATNYAHCDRLETMRLIEAEREAGVRLLNSLTDAELAREGLFKVPDQRRTTEQMARAMVSHVRTHLRNIQSALPNDSATWRQPSATIISGEYANGVQPLARAALESWNAGRADSHARTSGALRARCASSGTANDCAPPSEAVTDAAISRLIVRRLARS